MLDSSPTTFDQVGRRKPLFFFDFHDGDFHPTDVEGVDLPNIDEAKHEAARALAQIMSDVCVERDHRSIACHVRDTLGNVIYCATMSLSGGLVPEGTGLQQAQGWSTVDDRR